MVFKVGSSLGLGWLLYFTPRILLMRATTHTNTHAAATTIARMAARKSTTAIKDISLRHLLFMNRDASTPFRFGKDGASQHHTGALK
jgi:hypothetical protein